jgi:hypothetical protein
VALLGQEGRRGKDFLNRGMTNGQPQDRRFDTEDAAENKAV